jgi:hypothetical protein
MAPSGAAVRLGSGRDKTRNHGDDYEYCFSDVAHIEFLLSCVVVGVQVFVRDLLAPLPMRSLKRDAIGILGERSGEGLATAGARRSRRTRKRSVTILLLSRTPQVPVG